MKGASKGIGIFLIIVGVILTFFALPLGVTLMVIGVLLLIFGGIDFARMGWMTVLLIGIVLLFILIFTGKINLSGVGISGDLLIPILAIGGLLAMVYIMQKKSL